MKRLPALVLLAPLLASAELVQRSLIDWVCTPQNGCYARVLKEYSEDTTTGQVHGRYREWWIDSNDAILFERVDCNYTQGVKDGREILHPALFQPLTVHTTEWSGGKEVSSHQLTYDQSTNELTHDYFFRWESDDTQYKAVKSYYPYYDQGYYLDSEYTGTYRYAGSRSVVLELHSIQYSPETGNKIQDTRIQRGKGRIVETWYADGSLKAHEEYDDLERLHGHQFGYDDKGRLQYERNYRDGVRHGGQLGYSAGLLSLSETYEKGVRHGPSISYSRNPQGVLTSTYKGDYCNGQRCGTWERTYYNADGSVQSVSLTDFGGSVPLDLGEAEPETPDEKWLQGHVYDSTLRTPLAGVTISAGAGQLGTTDAAGYFSVKLGTDETYQLSLSRADYLTRTGRLDMTGYDRRNISVALVAVEDGNRPTVLDLRSPEGTVFYKGLTPAIRFDAAIDWASGAPGSVVFSLNGAAVSSGNEESITIDASALRTGSSKDSNTLEVVATNANGTQSVPAAINPAYIELPAWLTALGTPGGGGGRYTLARQWPEEPMLLQLNEQNLGSSAWKLWQLMPLVGGQAFGLSSTQALMELQLRSDGNGSLTLGGQTGLTAAGSEIVGKIAGKGSFNYTWGSGLKWKGGSMIIGLSGTIKREVGIAEVIPALKGATGLPVVGSSIAWINQQVRVQGSIGMGTEMEFDLVDRDYGLDFARSQGTLSTRLQLGLAGGSGKLKLALSGFGEARAVFQVPAEPDYLQTVEAELGAELQVTAWLFQHSFSGSHTFNYPVPAEASAEPATAAFAPIARDFLAAAPYNAAPDPDGMRPMGQSTGWDTLVANVFPFSDTSLDPADALAYVYFDPARPTLQATEIRLLKPNYPEHVVTNDTHADTAPAYFNNRLAWMRVKDAAFPESGSLEEMAAGMEIACMLNPYVPPVTLLTDNGHLDFAPQWAGDPASLTLFWLSNPGNLMVGTGDYPTTAHYSRVQGSAMAPPQPAGSYVGADDFQFLSLGGDLGVAWMQDMDNDISTTTDREVHFRRVGAGPQPPQRITSNSVAESSLQAFTVDGEPQFLWAEGNDLVHWNAAAGARVIHSFRQPVHAIQPVLDADSTNASRWLLLLGDATGYAVELLSLPGWELVPIRRDFTDIRIAQAAWINGALQIQGMRLRADGTDLVSTTVSGDERYPLQMELLGDIADPQPGRQLPLDFAIRNPDLAAREASYLGLFAGTQALSVLPVDALAPGATGTVSFTFTAPDGPECPAVLTVQPCDAAGTPASGEAVLFTHTLKGCDLQVTGLSFSDGPLDSRIASATVANTGPYLARDVLLRLLVDGQAVQSQVVPVIFGGGQLDVTFLLWESDLPSAAPAYAVIVDPARTIAETDEANNIHAYQAPGYDGLWATAETYLQYRYFDWFGWFLPHDSGYLYHFTHGWMYATGTSLSSFYLYDQTHKAWLWTSQSVYPFLYQLNEQDWWYFAGGSPAMRWFYSYKRDDYVVVQP